MTITKLMDDYHVVVGERVEFEIEVSEEGAHVMWSVYQYFSSTVSIMLGALQFQAMTVEAKQQCVQLPLPKFWPFSLCIRQSTFSLSIFLYLNMLYGGLIYVEKKTKLRIC